MMKYTPENGNITVEIGAENNAPYLSITDTGMGIPKEEQDRIFDRFYRSDAMKHPSIKGTGLGLSIVKRLTEILNLDFKLESEPEKGTKVRLIFPEN